MFIIRHREQCQAELPSIIPDKPNEGQPRERTKPPHRADAGEEHSLRKWLRISEFSSFLPFIEDKKDLGQWTLAAAAALSTDWKSSLIILSVRLSLSSKSALIKCYSPGLGWVLRNSRLSLFTALKAGEFTATKQARAAPPGDHFPRAAEEAQQVNVCWSCKRRRPILRTSLGDSHPPVTLTPWTLTPSFGLCGYLYFVHTSTQANKYTG